jgi:hypothetical protein
LFLRGYPLLRLPRRATTPAFLPEFEAMEPDLSFQIELGERAGREHWVDKIPQKLAQILSVIQTLRTGAVHGQMTRAEREGHSDERELSDRHRPWDTGDP